MRLISTLEELDRELDEAEKAAQVSDDALRSRLSDLYFSVSLRQGLPEDPYSHEYRESQLRLYESLAGKPYMVANEETHFDFEEELRRPFPYGTQSSQTVGDYLMSYGYAIKTMNLPARAKILEIGSGYGTLAVHLAAMGYDVTCLDVSEPLLSFIRQRTSHLYLQVHTICGDMLTAEIDDKFDAIVFFESFHHCLDHIKLLKRLLGLLNPGGLVAFCAEPIVGDGTPLLPYPWGLRLDGLSLLAIRRWGWMELGFCESYFKKLLRVLGWTTEHHYLNDSSLSNVWISRRITSFGRGKRHRGRAVRACTKDGMSTSHLLSQTLAELKRSVGNYGSVVARRKGVLGWAEHLAKRGLRKLILRHLDQQREINQAVVCALEELATEFREEPASPPANDDLTAFLGLMADPLLRHLDQQREINQAVVRALEDLTTKFREEPAPTPANDDLTTSLGLMADPHYAAERARLRQSILDRIDGCSPEGATPAEMAGYIGEAALRFGATIELLQQHVASGTKGKLLEIGSNPYFLTLLLKDSFPELSCTGVNYFEGGFPPQSMQKQSVTDPRGRLREVAFFHADVERHSLEALGIFDVCLFCEVIEHLPFDPAWALFNIVRTLRPGGLLLLTTPNPARLENLEKMIRHRATFSDSVSGYGIHGRHNREYAASELIELCSATGLTILEAKTIDVVPTLHSRDAEAKGYGAYHMILARLDETAHLVRPAWLYRSFTHERLVSSSPLMLGE